MTHRTEDDSAARERRRGCVIVSMSVAIFLLTTSMPIMENVRGLETALFWDDFDDTGLWPWTADDGTYNTVDIVDWPAYSHPYCLHIKKLSTNADPARAVSTYLEMNYDADYWIYVKFRLSTDMLTRGMLIIDDGRVHVWILVAPILEIDGEGVTIQVEIADGCYYALKAMVHPSRGTYDIVLNGLGFDNELVAEDVPFRDVPSKHLILGTESSSSKVYGEVYYDDIRVVGSPGPVYSDEFDGYSLGSIGDWTADTTGAGIVETSSIQYYSYPNSLHIDYSGSVSMARAESTLIDFNSRGFYEINMQYKDVNGKYVVVVDDGRLEVVERTGVLYAVKSSGSLALLGDLPYGQWHSIRICVNGYNHEFTLFLDGEQLGGTNSFKDPYGFHNLCMGSKVDPGRRDAGEAYWDDISVTEIWYPRPDSDGDGLVDEDEASYGTDVYGCDRWAVLVCGGIGDDQQEGFENDADYVYRTLTKIGYSDDHIAYLSYPYSDNVWRDLDDDGRSEVDMTSIYQNVEYTFTEWLPSVADRDDRILVVFRDHGGYVSFNTGIGYLCLSENENLLDASVDSWFDSLWSGGHYDRLVCLVDCCYSGNWLYGTGIVSGTNRVITTSSLYGQVSSGGYALEFFMHTWLDGFSVEETYDYIGEGLISDQCDPATNPNGDVYLM